MESVLAEPDDPGPLDVTFCLHIQRQLRPGSVSNSDVGKIDGLVDRIAKELLMAMDIPAP